MSRLTNKTALRRISAKRLAKLGGQMPHSSIVPKPGAKPKKHPRAGIRRSSAPPRKVRVKPVNTKRKAKNHERAYGAKREWIVSLPCAVCGYSAGPSDPAHAKGGGAGLRSSSKYLVPLCGARHVEGCHRESHRGIKTFEAKYGVTLLALAERYEAEWQALHPTEEQ